MGESGAAWRFGVAMASSDYRRLPLATRERIVALAATIRAHKEALDAIAGQVDGGMVCAACRGACCSRGKYHFSLVDLLVYLAAGQELFAPCFTQETCPFLGDGACLMPPAFRPFTCITFICDAIEVLLPPPALAHFTALTATLRDRYREMETLVGSRLSGGLLHYSEMALADGGRPIIGTASATADGDEE